jgi:hypothetical protein
MIMYYLNSERNTFHRCECDLNSFGSWKGPDVNSCEHDAETPSSVQGTGILAYLNECDPLLYVISQFFAKAQETLGFRSSWMWCCIPV